MSVLRDALQTRLWPVPTAGVLLAVALGVLMPYADTRVEDSLPPTVSTYLFGGGADAARTVLSAIGGSLITVTSLTFSLTVVTLQLASSQFSPRLLRTFSRDPFVHRTLALFLGTFAYSLVVLRTVRSSANSRPEFVPKISITVAVVLTLVSVFALVLFLDHLATQIRVETMLDDVHSDASDTVRRVLQKQSDQPEPLPIPPQVPTDASPIEVGKSGFLISVDEDALLAAACTASAVVQIEVFPGGWLVRGTPIGRSWPLGEAPLTREQQRTLSERVAAAAHAGRERTAAQDIAYGLRQLTDVATKALSPGINDPTTAVHALGHISGLLCEMVDYRLGPKLLQDARGRVRVVLKRPGLAELLDSALAQPRRYASTAPNVLARITLVLRDVAWRVRDPDSQQAVREQLLRMRETVGQAGLGTAETAELRRLDALVEQALAGRW